MTNLFALCLIITSLSAAGFWSPSPASQQGHDQQARDVIVKEGHRVVVVEYGQDQAQHNTKVSFISPQPNDPVSLDIESSERHRTRDVICDAYGKCKHKIASAMDKAAKVMVGSERDAMHAFDEAKETVLDSFEKAKETVSEKASDAKETVSESFEKASDAKETVSDSFEKAKERVSEKASELKEGAKERFFDRGVKVVKDYWLRFSVWVSRWRAAMEGMSLLGFSMAMGMGVWNTFISSYVLASALPRQQLGVVQSKIYPVYFRAMGCSIGMCLFGHVFAHKRWAYELVVALLMVFVNSVYLEPQATKVMFERLKLEREEGRGMMEDISCGQPVSAVDGSDNAPGPAVGATTQHQVVKSKMVGLNKKLKKLNSNSSLLNLLTLIALTWHLMYLTHRLSLPPPCH